VRTIIISIPDQLGCELLDFIDDGVAAAHRTPKPLDPEEPLRLGTLL
jgi:hypothetical protein